MQDRNIFDREALSFNITPINNGFHDNPFLYKETFLRLTDPQNFKYKGCLRVKCVLFQQIPQK